jgi:hypothetical protein
LCGASNAAATTTLAAAVVGGANSSQQQLLPICAEEIFRVFLDGTLIHSHLFHMPLPKIVSENCSVRQNKRVDLHHCDETSVKLIILHYATKYFPHICVHIKSVGMSMQINFFSLPPSLSLSVVICDVCIIYCSVYCSRSKNYNFPLL